MTNAELAVLSLVVQEPRHGYQIEQVIEERGMRRWTDIGFSSIYFLLKKLERQNLIKGEWEKTELGKERWAKVYRPTDAGHEAFHCAIIELLSTPQPHPYPLMLGLANLPAVSTDEAITALKQYRGQLTAVMQTLKDVRDSKQHTAPYYIEAMFEHHLTILKVEIDWLGEFIQQVKTKSQENRSK